MNTQNTRVSQKFEQKNHSDIQSEYNHLYQTIGIRDEDRAYRWHVRNIFNLKPGISSLLDVACGAGYFLREVYQYKNNVELNGVDISDVALEKARKECPQAAFQQGVAENLPYPDKKFDAIICLGSLEHFLNTRIAVQEMIRTAQDNALFYIMVPNMFWYKDIFSVLFFGRKLTRNQTSERFESLNDWVDILSECGLSVKKVQKYNGLAKHSWKQMLKDILIPLRFSYHFIFICSKKHG